MTRGRYANSLGHGLARLTHSRALKQSPRSLNPLRCRQGSVLLTVTGPILRFLAMREADMIARGEQPQETKMVFWPFAAAGVTLFGVGALPSYSLVKRGPDPAER
jgi:hypothetical protein